MDQLWAGDANSGEILGIYLPKGTPANYQYPFHWSRADLWPGVCVYIHFSSYNSSPDNWSKASSPDTVSHNSGSVGDATWPVLMLGVPVVHVQVTAPNASLAIPGRGFYHAPGGVERRWESPLFTCGQKDAILAVQYLKHNRVYIDGVLRTLGGFGWADGGMVLMGTSAGADIVSGVALHPNRAYELGTWGPYLEDTRVNHAILAATNVCKPSMFSGAVTFFNNLPKSETSTAGATTIVSASSCVFAATGNTITKAATTWASTPIVGSVLIVTGASTNPDPLLVRVTAATSTVITCSPLYSTLVNETATVTIKTVQSEEEATTLSAAPTRYVHEMGCFNHIPNYTDSSLTSYLMWSDTAAIEYPGWGDGAEGVLTVAHAPETFLLLKQAAPRRGKLYMHTSFSAFPYDTYARGIPDGFYNNALFIDSSNQRTAGLIAQSVVKNLRRPIAKRPRGGMRRSWHVDTVGRTICPPDENRQSITITNTGESTASSAAVSSDLHVGTTKHNMIAVLSVGESITIGGDGSWFTGPLYAYSSSGQAKYLLVENYGDM